MYLKVFEGSEFKSEVHLSRNLINYHETNSKRATKEADGNAYDFLENSELGVFTCEKFESGIQSFRQLIGCFTVDKYRFRK